MRKLESLGVPSLLLRWLHSFLTNRQQRVKIGNIFSSWDSPRGGMPQGTWLGPYSFISFINDLESLLELHKFVDDCTLSEFIAKLCPSMMQSGIDIINSWSTDNNMNINTKKTKEMLLGTLLKNPPPSLQLNGSGIERVHSYKLLGFHVTDSLKWHEHCIARRLRGDCISSSYSNMLQCRVLTLFTIISL